MFKRLMSALCIVAMTATPGMISPAHATSDQLERGARKFERYFRVIDAIAALRARTPDQARRQLARADELIQRTRRGLSGTAYRGWAYKIAETHPGTQRAIRRFSRMRDPHQALLRLQRNPDAFFRVAELRSVYNAIAQEGNRNVERMRAASDAIRALARTARADKRPLRPKPDPDRPIRNVPGKDDHLQEKGLNNHGTDGLDDQASLADQLDAAADQLEMAFNELLGIRSANAAACGGICVAFFTVVIGAVATGIAILVKEYTEAKAQDFKDNDDGISDFERCMQDAERVYGICMRRANDWWARTNCGAEKLGREATCFFIPQP